MGRQKKKSKKSVPVQEQAPVPKTGVKLWKWAMIPAILALLLYANTYDHGYVLDDFPVLLKNTHVQEGFSGFKDILTHNYLHGLSEFNDGLYRPLSQLMFAAEVSAFKNQASAHHIINILLYALTGFLLFHLLYKLFPDRGVLLPLLIALIYIAHPIHTESVANLKGRDEILCFLNFIMATWFYLKYQDTGKQENLISGSFFFMLAFLSKESAITYVAAIPVLFFLLKRGNNQRLAITGGSLAVVAAIMLSWRYYVIQSMPNPVDQGIFDILNNPIHASDNFIDQLGTGIYLQFMYLQKLIFPHPLIHDYSYNQIPLVSLFSVQGLLGLVVIAGAGYGFYYAFKNNRPLAVAIAFHFITLSVVANILIHIGATFAERFLFTPSLGFSIALGLLLILLAKNRNKSSDDLALILKKNTLFTVLCLGILAFYSFKTVTRNLDWRDNFTLYEADIENAGQSARAHYNYGSELFNRAATSPTNSEKQKLLKDSKTHLEAATKIYPDYFEALNNLGNTLSALEDYNGAIQVLNRLIQINPNYSRAYFNLALAYSNSGYFDEAIRLFQKHLSLQPNSAMTYYQIGVTYGKMNRFDDAIANLNQCIAIQPNHVDALLFLGQAYGIKKDAPRAIGYFQQVLKLNPNHPEAYFNLGVSHMIQNQPAQAIPYFEKAIALVPNHKAALSGLAEALDKTGNSSRAAQIRARL